MQSIARFYAAGPAGASLLLGTFSLLEWLRVFPRFSGSAMSIQFLVIHSSAFIFSLPFWNVKESAKPVIFKVMLVLYAAFAFKTDGLLGIAEFAGLTYATYYSYIFTRTSTGERMPLVLRWAATFFLFIVATGLAGAPEDVDAWTGNRRLALAGTLYFIPAGLIERSGFYQDGWRRLACRLLERKPGLKGALPNWLAGEIYKGKEGI